MCLNKNYTSRLGKLKANKPSHTFILAGFKEIVKDT